MQRNLMWTLKQLHLTLEQYGKIQMRDMDLSPTQGILLHYLLTHKGQVIYGIDLHTALGISKASVSTTLKALKQKGYLKKMKENPSDDRKKQIVLTKKAYDTERLIHASLLSQRRRLCQEIPKQRLEWLEEDLDQMLYNLKKDIE